MSIMDGSPSIRAARLTDLDMTHQNNIHQTEMLHRDEEFRRLKLRLLSLRDENAILKNHLSQKDLQHRKLAKKYGRVSDDLGEGYEKTRTQDAKLKRQATEIISLKAEIESLSNSTQDTGKVLQEKFARERELDRLRPELEHIKSQLVHQQNVVAEKHNLQHQLDSLEVELEHERRARKKIQDREDRNSAEDSRAKLDDIEKRLTHEKTAQEKMKRQYEMELSEAQGRQDRLEERLSTMKLKLKSTQTELKETRVELEKCQTALAKSRAAQDKAPHVIASKPQLNRKRRADESSLEEITIQTPGNDSSHEKRQAKKRGAEKAILGEKSAFSITPFLNRSKELSDESEIISPAAPSLNEQNTAAPISDEAISQPIEGTGPPETNATVKSVARTKPAVASSAAQKPRGRPKTRPLVEVTTSKGNIAPMPDHNVDAGGKPAAQTAVPDDQTNTATIPKATKPAGLKVRQMPKVQGATHISAAAGDIKRRKRKLLGIGNGTIMEEDDGEAVARPVQKVQLGQGVRKRAPLGGGMMNAFAGSSFSPLKRERRGVGASFLV